MHPRADLPVFDIPRLANEIPVYPMMIETINRIAGRHRMPVWRALPYEASVRAYRRSATLRRLASPVFGRSTPSSWTFMGGCYNAGTTAVKDALTLHPQVRTLPIEGDLLTGSLSNFEEGGWARCMYANRHSVDADRADGHVDRTALERDWAPWTRDGLAFVDKAISHSCRIPHLAAAFPDARFVIVTRRPEAVVRGIAKRSRPLGAAREAYGSDTYDPGMLEKQWSWLYRLALADLPAKRGLIVAYESFVADPVRETKRLHAFLDLPSVSVTLEDQTLLVDGRAFPVRGAGTGERGLDTHEDVQAEMNRLDTPEGGHSSTGEVLR